MDYNKIPQMLKRHSFAEKMSMSQFYSKQLMTPTGLIQPAALREVLLTWELETFVLFSIASVEWRHDDFSGKNKRKFFSAMNAIRNHNHPFLESNKGTLAFVNLYLIAMGAVQFDTQEYYPYKLYRYNFYFSFSNDKINMPQIFQAKFGCSYSDFIVFAQFLWLVFSAGHYIIPHDLLEFLSSKFKIVVSQLSITREKYIEELSEITTDISDYLYCLRPSYSYPFIADGRHNRLHFPLPHLLMRSITSSLLHRLTEGDNTLSERIGKEVLEPYLYNIIEESDLFDEVFSEQEYIEKRNQQRTLDVMARKSDTFVFFDSKMLSPKRGLRIFEEQIFEQEVARLAKAFKQMYLHIHDRFPKLYNPFSRQVKVEDENVYGIVVVRDNPHIMSEHIYRRTAELLNMPTGSAEFHWLCRHVGIVAIYDIEKYCFTQSDILSAIIANNSTGKTNDHWLTTSIDKYTITNNKVLSFRHNLSNQIDCLLKDCERAGVISQ